jgi:hypothetical protein
MHVDVNGIKGFKIAIFALDTASEMLGFWSDFIVAAPSII